MNCTEQQDFLAHPLIFSKMQEYASFFKKGLDKYKFK